MHIAFLTLFLGLVSGRVPVALAVSLPVTAVEVALDGGSPMRLGPTFRGEVDLGPDLLPHHLVARGLDALGHEVERTEQWLNLPQAWAELNLLPEPRRDGRLVAIGLSIQSRTFEPPRTVTASLDGKPVAVVGHRILIPPYPGQIPHLLSVEARFDHGETVHRDLAFGGDLAGEIATDLTQVLVRPRHRMPTLAELAAGFQVTAGATSTPATPTAIEQGEGEILVVRDPQAVELLRHLARPADPSGTFELRLGTDDRLRFIDVHARSYYSGEGSFSNLFNLTQEVDGQKAGLYWRLVNTQFPGDATAGGQFADAVTVAGLQAFAGHRRRAILLVLSGLPGDGSRITPTVARRYLAALRLPLHVWSLRPPPYPVEIAAWGTVEDVSTLQLLRAAHDRLMEGLDSQRIVWLDGRFLPQSITLAPQAAAALELVRGPER